MKRILKNDGFTMMELMVVVAIIGIMVTIGIPAYVKMMPHLRLRSAVMDVSDVLQLARMKAVAKNTTYVVTFHYSPTNSYEMGPSGGTVENTSSGLGWKGIDLVDQGSSADLPELKNDDVSGTVAFKSDGTASVNANTDDIQGKGAIYLRNNPINNFEEFRVVVTEISGKITVQHLAGAAWAD